LSEWRSDVEGFIPREVVERCVRNYIELPPRLGIAYRCFADPASGVEGGDSYAIAVEHKEGDRIVVDAIREVRPPFSAFEVINNVLVPLCKAYGVHCVRGDAYGGDLAREPIRRAGLSYELADKHASQLYADPFLGFLNANKIDLPNNERLINQICGLERSVQRSGRDQITHPPHAHDDLANAVAGGCDYAANYTLFDSTFSWVSGRKETPEEAAENNARWRQQKINQYIMHAAGAPRANNPWGRGGVDWSRMPNPRGW
jgi:hypothetical protein